MKTIGQLIIESEQLKNYLGYSFSEMENDYESLDSISLKERKAIGKKYGIDSGKTKEVQNAILNQMREERKVKNTYTQDDIRMFNRFESSFKKLIDLEHPKFIEFLKDQYWKKLEEKKLTNKLSYVKSRDWNYSLSYAQRDLIMNYLATVEWLNAHDPKTIKDKEDKTNIENAIRIILVEQTKDFHDSYIEHTKKRAADIYEFQKRRKAEFQPKVDYINEQIKNIGTITYNSKEYEEYKQLKNERDKYQKIVSTANSIIKNSKQKFIKNCENDAENAFNKNINILAEKINERGIDTTKLEVKRIYDDPKYFQLYITDGTKTLYARSILAAQFSDKVTAHFRFIITDKKQNKNNN